VSSDADKVTTFGIASFPQKKVKAVMWMREDNSNHLTATEILDKGEKIVAVVRGVAKGYGGWADKDPRDPHGLAYSEFTGRLVEAED
jgi:hypothetical protein